MILMPPFLRRNCEDLTRHQHMSLKFPRSLLLPTLSQGCGHQQQSENKVMLLRQRQRFAYASSDKVKSYTKSLENDLPVPDVCDIDNFEANLSNKPESADIETVPLDTTGAFRSDPLDHLYDCYPTDDTTEANLNNVIPPMSEFLRFSIAIQFSDRWMTNPKLFSGTFAPSEGNTDTEVLQEGFDNSHSHDLSVNSLLVEDFDNDDFGANLNEEQLFWYMNNIEPYMDKLSGCENSSITNHTFEEHLDRDDSLPNGKC